MKKKAVLVTAFFGLIIIFSLYHVNMRIKVDYPETMLRKAFECSSAKVVKSEIYCWASLNGINAQKKFAEQLTDEIKKIFGIVENEDYLCKSNKDGDVGKLEIKGVTSDKKIVDISCVTDKIRDESCVTVRIVQDMSSMGLEEARKKLLAAFGKHGLQPRVNSCITGYFNGKLGYNDLNSICAKIFDRAEAKKVEGMRDSRLISVSAYTPAIGRFVEVNNKKVNLNLAIRYNSYEDKTYIWLATPVITTEY